MEALFLISAEGDGDHDTDLFRGKISPIPPTSLKGNLSPIVLTRKTEFPDREESVRRFCLPRGILIAFDPSPSEIGFVPASSVTHVWPQEYPWRQLQGKTVIEVSFHIIWGARIVPIPNNSISLKLGSFVYVVLEKSGIFLCTIHIFVKLPPPRRGFSGAQWRAGSEQKKFCSSCAP